jgi:hypothetical protein
MKSGDRNKCMNCEIELTIKNRVPVYSSRLKVIGFRCNECHEKSKSPETKQRENEISKFIKEVPQLENVKHDIRRALNEK